MGSTDEAAMSRATFDASAVRTLAVAVSLLLVPAAAACGPDASDETAATRDAAPAEDAGPAGEHSGYLTAAEGARLFFRVVGEGRDTVVVLHGGPGAGMNSVRPAFEPLTDELSLIFFDQRGGGRSTLPADTALLRGPYFVEDLDSVRAHFGLERMNLLTHSFGAVLAGSYAREHPDRVGAIVLHGATGPVRERAARLARRAPPPSPDTALSRRSRELIGSLLDGSAPDPAETCRRWEETERRLARLRDDTAALAWEGSSCDMPPEAVGYYFRYTAQHAPRTFGDWDFSRGLEEVDAPVLVIHGDGDSLAVAEQRAWASAFPRGQLMLVPDAAKGAIARRPETVRRAIVEFFRQQGRPEGGTPGA